MKKSLELFQQIVHNLLEDETKNPVAEFVPSGELFERMDLDLEEHPISEEDLATILQDLVFKAPRTATNAFFNQLFGGRNDKAILGDLLSVMLNNSMYTYKAAGPMIGVEKAVLRKVCDIIGWDENAGGTFASGGSMTNFMGMLMARDSKQNEARYEGVKNNLTVYTSAESHYSTPKNAAFSGIGRNQVRSIAVDEVGRMDVDALEAAIVQDINEGYVPTLVNATAGTTVLGAFDNVDAIAGICHTYNIWFHVDGAYCGSVIFSKKYTHLLKGLEKVDSFSLNAHKMMGTPLTCSLLMVKDKKYLYDSFSNDASYLYQTDHDDFNLGKTSLQCGRRNDALKFWTLWKSVGTQGLEGMVNKQFELADVARDYVRNHEDYEDFSIDDSISVCFNYKGIPARDLCTLLYEHSQLLVGYGSFGDREFVRLVTINVNNDKDVILNFFATLERFVEENEALFLKNRVSV
ncbi:aminotransferase class V-fold PLP-dependent enzyme [Aureisphaera galaxeae]|uniref:pyridoxal phosphate-dependent decarboxylase family protein n=1 Tax=Aureisphaera galaxeae TaxID=1538023 RepID=UPI002350DC7E|nr:aminotransferase class V-fold PLP-dependent enzyme [Aureisphaera galaxeae]MDC8004017.1 aminotransferase class V-fold PLP-dependent enzyme [Aureisphaera galaxeae]